jgi:hypothetical protein
MPDRQQIEFIIKPDGSVEERVTGVAGSSCEDITKAIEQALGEVTGREHTPDYYREQETGGSVTTQS